MFIDNYNDELKNSFLELYLNNTKKDCHGKILLKVQRLEFNS